MGFVFVPISGQKTGGQRSKTAPSVFSGCPPFPCLEVGREIEPTKVAHSWDQCGLGSHLVQVLGVLVLGDVLVPVSLMVVIRILALVIDVVQVVALVAMAARYPTPCVGSDPLPVKTGRGRVGAEEHLAPSWKRRA